MIEFGLSVFCEDHFEKLPLRKVSGFDFLEFSGSLLDSDSACRKLESLNRAGCGLVVRDLLDPALVHLVPTENFQVKLEFDRKLHERCRIAGNLGVNMAGAAFDIMAALEHQDYSDKLVHLLKSTFATFNQYNLDVVFPGRIPSPPGGTDITQVMEFAAKMLYSRIFTVIEFHPHEPGAFEELEKHYDVIRFHRNFWRVFFEPEHGNYLSQTLFKRFLDTANMKNIALSKIAIAPGRQLPDETVLKELLKLIGDIEDEY